MESLNNAWTCVSVLNDRFFKTAEITVYLLAAPFALIGYYISMLAEKWYDAAVSMRDARHIHEGLRAERCTERGVGR